MARPFTGTNSFRGADFVAGTLNATGNGGTSLGLIDASAVTHSEVENIDTYLSGFMTSNRLNVAFVDQITLTVGSVGMNDKLMAQWKIVANNLGNKYKIKVALLVDPDILRKLTPTATPNQSSATYVDVGVSVSGVRDGDKKYSDPGAVSKGN